MTAPKDLTVEAYGSHAPSQQLPTLIGRTTDGPANMIGRHTFINAEPATLLGVLGFWAAYHPEEFDKALREALAPRSFAWSPSTAFRDRVRAIVEEVQP